MEPAWHGLHHLFSDHPDAFAAVAPITGVAPGTAATGAALRAAVTQARRIVTDARRALYRLLAEETPEE